MDTAVLTRGLQLSSTAFANAHAVLRRLHHAAASDGVEPDVQLNGAALGLADPLILTECPVRAVWAATGEVGYGNLERNQRLSRLDRE